MAGDAIEFACFADSPLAPPFLPFDQSALGAFVAYVSNKSANRRRSLRP
jgi:hypothetical protein